MSASTNGVLVKKCTLSVKEGPLPQGRNKNRSLSKPLKVDLIRCASVCWLTVSLSCPIELIGGVVKGTIGKRASGAQQNRWAKVCGCRTLGWSSASEAILSKALQLHIYPITSKLLQNMLCGTNLHVVTLVTKLAKPRRKGGGQPTVNLRLQVPWFT